MFFLNLTKFNAFNYKKTLNLYQGKIFLAFQLFRSKCLKNKLNEDKKNKKENIKQNLKTKLQESKELNKNKTESNSNTISNKISYVEFPYIDDINIDNLKGNHIFIDPGKRALFTMMNDEGNFLKLKPEDIIFTFETPPDEKPELVVYSKVSHSVDAYELFSGVLDKHTLNVVCPTLKIL